MSRTKRRSRQRDLFARGTKRLATGQDRARVEAMPDAATYSKLHRKFLRENQPAMFEDLREKGTLDDHVANVGQSAMETFETISTQMATAKDLPADYRERVAALEAIPHVAEEIVLAEIVFQPLPSESTDLPLSEPEL